MYAHNPGQPVLQLILNSFYLLESELHLSELGSGARAGHWDRHSNMCCQPVTQAPGPSTSTQGARQCPRRRAGCPALPALHLGQHSVSCVIAATRCCLHNKVQMDAATEGLCTVQGDRADIPTLVAAMRLSPGCLHSMGTAWLSIRHVVHGTHRCSAWANSSLHFQACWNFPQNISDLCFVK